MHCTVRMNDEGCFAGFSILLLWDGAFVKYCMNHNMRIDV
jgi:hypothetical protein